MYMDLLARLNLMFRVFLMFFVFSRKTRFELFEFSRFRSLEESKGGGTFFSKETLVYFGSKIPVKNNFLWRIFPKIRSWHENEIYRQKFSPSLEIEQSNAEALSRARRLRRAVCGILRA